MDYRPGDAWIEYEPDRNLTDALCSILARDHLGEMQAIGTGFVIRTSEHRGLVLTAGHVIDHVFALQQEDFRRSHRTVLPEFAPSRRAIDLSPRILVVLLSSGGRPAFGLVEGVAFDRSADLALMQIGPQAVDAYTFPLREFMVGFGMPRVGQDVHVATYANLSCETEQVTQGARFSRRSAHRGGKVLGVYPDGHRLCRGPCFETSIPVYSGMSGSPVFLLGQDNKPRVIGVVCSDPDVDGPHKEDQSIAGLSLIAHLQTNLHAIDESGGESYSLSLTLSEDTCGTFESWDRTIAWPDNSR